MNRIVSLLLLLISFGEAAEQCQPLVNETITLKNISSLYPNAKAQFHAIDTVDKETDTLRGKCHKFSLENGTCYGASQMLATGLKLGFIMGQKQLEFAYTNGTLVNNFTVQQQIYRITTSKNINYHDDRPETHSQTLTNSSSDDKFIKQYVYWPMGSLPSQQSRVSNKDLIVVKTDEEKLSQDRGSKAYRVFADNRIRRFAVSYVQYDIDAMQISMIGVSPVRNAAFTFNFKLRYEEGDGLYPKIRPPRRAITWLSEQVARSLDSVLGRHPSSRTVYGSFSLDDTLTIDFSLSAEPGLLFDPSPATCQVFRAMSSLDDDDDDNAPRATTSFEAFSKVGAASFLTTPTPSILFVPLLVTLIMFI